MFSCETCETFKNTYFEEYLRTAASVAKIRNSVRDIIPEFCYPFILGHTGKVGPVTRDSGPGLIHGTQDPGSRTWDSTLETRDP